MNLKAIYKRNDFLIFFIMGLGLCLRLYKINSPILDLYPTRQEQCAMIARNFFWHGLNIFNPEVDWFGGFNSVWRIEFPLVSYLAAFLYTLFGVHEYLGRIVSVIFSLWTIYLIYKFAGKLFNRRIGAYASFLFSVSPLAVYFGRAFMSDSAMLFFLVASLYYFFCWTQNGLRIYYFISTIMAAVSFLLKIPAAYIYLPIFYLGYSKLRNKIFLKPDMYIFFLVSMLPSLAWYSNASNNMFNFYIANKSNIEVLLKPDFYRRILESLSIFVLTPLGAFLAFFGLILSVNKRASYLLHFWFIGLLVYTFVAPELSYIHYHYQLPFVPVFAIFAARALDKLHDLKYYQQTIFLKMDLNLVVFLSCIFILISSFISTIPFYKWNPGVLKASEAVNALTKKNAILIAGRCMQQAPLYYTYRKGWETNEEPGGLLAYSWSANLDQYNFVKEKGRALKMPCELELVKFLMLRGADYYFTTNMNIFRKDPEFKMFMYDSFKVIAEESNFVIFKLDNK